MHYSMVKPLCSNFGLITANFSGVRIFRSFMVTAGVVRDEYFGLVVPSSGIDKVGIG